MDRATLGCPQWVWGEDATLSISPLSPPFTLDIHFLYIFNHISEWRMTICADLSHYRLLWLRYKVKALKKENTGWTHIKEANQLLSSFLLFDRSISDRCQKYEHESRKTKHDNRESLTEAAASLLPPGSASVFPLPCIACSPKPRLLLGLEFSHQAPRPQQYI